jgi:hypothetical protein
LSAVALALALVTSFGVMPSLEVMLIYPHTLAPDGGLFEKSKQQTIWISSF